MNVRLRSAVPWILVVLIVSAGVGTRAAGQAPASSPVGVARAVYPIDVKDGKYDLIIQVGDFPPGSSIPLHTHPGPVVATVITGEITFSADGRERVVKAGQGWVEIPDDPNAVFNRSTGYTRAAAAYLIPRGAAQTKFVK
ncbi:MAG TPA: cupin domain-containing protein [bacterium]|nr:cupin domain-containing protein [bacterium]